ncbi:hypothetical protein AB1L42_01515 [Thalassoglobus sp. JC818]|uniref:hypothetical protein n=1 Tax=Thalassoglobus sp. JC818 TaxID=3232136 RepID=UPI0034575CD9
MTAIERIAESLEGSGYKPVLADSVETQKSLSTLVVPFRPDELGREYSLFIEVMPAESQDAVEFIHFSLIYPFVIDHVDCVPEVIRTLFLLNRFLPVGRHQFCEQTPAVFFQYQLVVSGAMTVDPDLIREVVDMIGFFTRNHGRFISRIFQGEINAEQFIEELEVKGIAIPPLFGISERNEVNASLS